MVLAVMRELKVRDPDLHIDLLALTTGIDFARRQGFTTITYRDFVHWYDPETLQKHAAPHLAGTQHPLIDAEETTAYLGINFEDLHQQLGAQAAAQTYADKGRWAFMPLNFMRRLMRQLKPDLVLTTNSPRSEQAAITVAAELGIPSVCMVDLFSPAGDPFLDRTHYADTLTTISEVGKNNLVAGGVPKERIHVTGSPAFDGIFSEVRRKEAIFDRIERGWEGLTVILWPGTLELLPHNMAQVNDPAEFPKRAEKILRDYVAKHKDTALVVRYHPNHVSSFTPDLTQDRVLWSDAASRHVHRDIHLSNIVVVQATTVGLEAAIAGKSVISLDHSAAYSVFPCSQLGISKGVHSFEDLPLAIDEAIRLPYKSALARSSSNAAAEVVKIIEQKISKAWAPG